MGFDVPLVYGSGVHLGLSCEGRLGETRLDIAQIVAHLGGDVALLPRVLTEDLRRQPGVQLRCALRHGGQHVDHRGQHLVVDFDQRQRLFCHLRTRGGYGGHGVTTVESLIGGQHIVAQVLDARRTLAQVDDLVVGSRCRQVGAGDDGAYAGQGHGFAGVDATNARVRVGTAQHLAEEHAGQTDVGAIDGASRDLVDSIVADGTRAENLETAVTEVTDLAVAGRCHCCLPV